MSPTTSTSSGRTSGPSRTASNISRREPRRQPEATEQRRNQPRDVGVGLLDRDARLQPRDALIAEVAEEDLRAIEAERQDDRRVVAKEREVLREARR